MQIKKLSVMFMVILTGLSSVSSVYAYQQYDHYSGYERSAQHEQRHTKEQSTHRNDISRSGQKAHPASHHNTQHRASAPQHHYKRGGHLAKRYYQDRRYYVKDWRGHGLRQPPRGHRWIDVDGRFILVAVASGVIASVLLHNHHH